MELKKYVVEILSIARKNNVDVGAAKSMFLSNIEQGVDKYTGAEVDYAALHDAFPREGTEELTAVSNAYETWMHENYVHVTTLWREGKVDELKAFAE